MTDLDISEERYDNLGTAEGSGPRTSTGIWRLGIRRKHGIGKGLGISRRCGIRKSLGIRRGSGLERGPGLSKWRGGILGRVRNIEKITTENAGVINVMKDYGSYLYRNLSISLLCEHNTLVTYYQDSRLMIELPDPLDDGMIKMVDTINNWRRLECAHVIPSTNAESGEYTLRIMDLCRDGHRISPDSVKVSTFRCPEIRTFALWANYIDGMAAYLMAALTIKGEIHLYQHYRCEFRGDMKCVGRIPALLNDSVLPATGVDITFVSIDGVIHLIIKIELTIWIYDVIILQDDVTGDTVDSTLLFRLFDVGEWWCNERGILGYYDIKEEKIVFKDIISDQSFNFDVEGAPFMIRHTTAGLLNYWFFVIDRCVHLYYATSNSHELRVVYEGIIAKSQYPIISFAVDKTGLMATMDQGGKLVLRDIQDVNFSHTVSFKRVLQECYGDNYSKEYFTRKMVVNMMLEDHYVHINIHGSPYLHTVKF